VWTLQFGSPEADVREADPFGHLLSVHNPTGPDLYRDEPWASYGILQGPKTSDRARLGREIRESRHPTKPLCAQETPPGNRYQLSSTRAGTSRGGHPEERLGRPDVGGRPQLRRHGRGLELGHLRGRPAVAGDAIGGPAEEHGGPAHAGRHGQAAARRRYAPGGAPNRRRKALLKAASDS
jgi:hypothetical protein